MKTDDLLYQLFRRYPHALSRMAGLPYEGHWTFESITVKSTEKRLDGFLCRQDAPTPFFMFAEFQGYRESSFYWRLYRELATWYEQNPDESRPFVAVVIFLSRSHDPHNAQLKPLGNNKLLRIYLPEVLKRLKHQPGPWTLLEPLVLKRASELKQRGPDWRRLLQTLPLTPDERILCTELLMRGLLARFKSLSLKEIETMFELTPLTETRAGQEMIQMGQEQGQKELLLRLLRARFGELPTGILTRLEELHEPNRLASLAEQVLFARSLTELRWE
ncbi:MAG: DUF2887 domain-containing protein [Myxococcota bacterium]